MLKRFLVCLVVLSIAFPATLFAGVQNKKPPVTEQESVETGTTTTTEQPGSTPQPITQEEYDKKMKSAKTLSTTGLVLLGVGGAAFLGGLIYVVAKSPSSEETQQNAFAGFRALPGACMMVGGLIVGGTGGGLMIGGAAKKRHLKERQIISLSPSIDPAHSTYGVALSANF